MQLAILNGEELQYKCPACGWHSVPVKVGRKEDRYWQWNGSLEKPSISPSVKHFHNGTDAIPPFCCHYIMTDGVMDFCGDCTHDKRGQVPMIPYSDAEVQMSQL